MNTLKRGWVRAMPLPDAEAVLGSVGRWIEDYDDNHPHSGLKMRSPREFIATRTATARVSGETGGKITGSHSTTLSELHAGFVRVPIGVIAAPAVTLLTSGSWIFSAVADAYRLWAFYLLGVIGFQRDLRREYPETGQGAPKSSNRARDRSVDRRV